MKRREFIQKLALASLSLKLIPIGISNFSDIRFSLDHVMGIDNSHLAAYSNLLMEFNTLQSYRKMKEAAASEGIQLQAINAFKSFSHEQNVFENELFHYLDQGKTILDAYKIVTEYVPIPGTSRYHWGTDIDLIDLNVDIPHGYVIDEEHYLPGGMFYHLTQWLQLNAAQYDFYQPYTEDVYRKGFGYEPWHYSYQPVASQIIKRININELVEKIHTTQLEGLDLIPDSFLPNYIEDFMFGINKELLYF